MSEEERLLREIVDRWTYYKSHIDPENPNVSKVVISNFSGDVDKARAYLAEKDTAMERTSKIIEIYKELAEERRKAQLRQGASLGFAAASRKMERLGIPAPRWTEGDWDCLPASAPSLRGEITEGEHAPTYIAASWTGEWEVWGWKDGEYWSHHGKISRKAIEERVEFIMTELYKEAAKKRGIEL